MRRTAAQAEDSINATFNQLAFRSARIAAAATAGINPHVDTGGVAEWKEVQEQSFDFSYLLLRRGAAEEKVVN